MDDNRRRLRSLELRSEDVQLLRVIVSVVLRLIGALLVLWSAGYLVTWTGFWSKNQLSQASVSDLFLTFGQPLTYTFVGIAILFSADAVSRWLVPHTVSKPRCPACRYEITSLADGRCPECGYEVSPLRDGSLTPHDRFVLVRSANAAGIRLLGMVLVAYGMSVFALYGLSDLLLSAEPYSERYRGDRRMLWSVILVVLGIVVYALAEHLARVALMGIARTVTRPDRADQSK